MRHSLKEISEFPGIENVFVDNISNGLISHIKLVYKIPKDKELLFVWNYGAENLVITIDSIYYKIIENGANDIIVINWKDVVKVEYYDRLHINNTNENRLKAYHFYDSNDLVINSAGRRRFGIVENTSDETIEKVEFYLNYIAENYDYFKVMEEIDSLCDIPEKDEDIETYANEIIRTCDTFIQNNKAFEESIYEKLATALELKGEYVSAIQTIEKIIKNTKKDDSNLWINYYYIASLYDLLANPGKALENLRISYSICDDSLEKIDINKKIEILTLEFNETFIDLPYSQRKLIVVNDELQQVSTNAFLVLDKNNLPANLKFPNNEPKSRELYIAHPYLKEVYLSFATYEINLSADKFDEFFYFVQCLGAKKITYKVIKGNNKNQSKNEKLNVDGSLGIGKSVVKNTLSGSVGNDTNSNNQEDSLNARAKTQTFKPTKAPYIPKDLLWYPQEQTWHRLYQQRMNGNIDTHHETISSKNASTISETQKTNLKVAFKNFYVDANINVDHLLSETFSQSESIQWEIDIEFESIENLTVKNIEEEPNKIIEQSYFDNEEAYIEELKFMLEDDGIIDEKERRVLDRFREKNGLSKERATELENKLLSVGDLNDNEKEYKEEFQELLNDGEITEKERRILNRMAGRLGISEERAKELER